MGEFIDFAGQSMSSAKSLKVNITNVLAPKIGSLYPSRVEAEVILSLKDLSPLAKMEWTSLKANEALYLVSFDKDWPDAKSLGEFAQSKGIKITRGAYTRIADRKVIENGENADEMKVKIVLDSVQYKNDLEYLVAKSSKFLEDIYSEC
jgi:hypothetical protein